MATPTVICVDNSGSTSGCRTYFRKVNEVLEQERNIVIIPWNSTASIVDPGTRTFSSLGGTDPSSFLKILIVFDHDFNLVVTTDGEIYDHDLILCQQIIDSSNLLAKIKSFKIYFIGRRNEMNLRISSLFNAIQGEKTIFINEEEPILVRGMDLGRIQNLTFQDFENENSIVASVLSMIQMFPDKKSEIRAEICKLSNKLIAQELTEGSIKPFYERGDIDGCVSYVKNFDNTNKKKFQQVVGRILNLFDAKDCYSLSHLSNTNVLKEQTVEVEENIDDDDDDDEESEDDLICDILFRKIEYLCIPVKLIPEEGSTNADKFAIFPDKLSKKYSSNPFMILKDKGVIERIIKRVEPQKLDLVSYNKFEKHGGRVRSPFSRDVLKGVFIFHSDEDELSNYNKIYKNNNRTLSFIFGEDNKLPGNKALWNVLFLYILIKHHGEWKQYEAKLKEEILFISRNARSFITFNPILNPSIMETLDVCLWYVVKVAHRAFENTHSNVLRSIEGSEDLLDFYSYLFGEEDLDQIRDRVKKWNLWKYFVRNKSDWRLKLDVISHFQNSEDINGSKVLFSGKSNTNLYGVDPREVFRLYTLLKQSPAASLVDDLNKQIAVEYYKPVDVPDDIFDDLDHVLICVSTCNPLVICPITKAHWKDCLRDMADRVYVNDKSYVRLFKRFCLKYNRYPKDENELLVFHSNAYNKNHEDCMVYPMNCKKTLRKTFNKFADVMKTLDVKEYLELSEKYCNETLRVEREKQCSKCKSHEIDTMVEKINVSA